MSHETWQLMHSFECLVSHTELKIKDFFAVYFDKKKQCWEFNVIIEIKNKLFVNLLYKSFRLYVFGTLINNKH